MIEKDREEARQAQRSPGHMVKHALIGGIALVVVGFIVVWLVMS